MQWPFRNMGTSIVISGHEHSYERLEMDSLTYIINGNGGATLRPFPDTLHESKVRYYQNFGAQLVETYTDSIVFRFFNINDSLVDYYVLKHKHRVFGDISTLIQFCLKTFIYIQIRLNPASQSGLRHINILNKTDGLQQYGRNN